MFYQKEGDKALRFGDVLNGSVITESVLDELDSKTDYRVRINVPTYCVLLSPCCSISNEVITVSPLVEIYGSFFDNPYFSEDLTRINRKMDPRQAVAPRVWENLPLEEKERRLAEGVAYGLRDVFIYEGHELFPYYMPQRRDGGASSTNYYMIDFKHLHCIRCEKIKKADQAPLETKCLQLTIETREQLRNKIAEYYGRVPKEDSILED